MTPDLLLLSRAVAALPGAPAPGRTMVPCDTADNNGYRDESGIRWVWDDERSDFRLFDLADAATGGVLWASIRADIFPSDDGDTVGVFLSRDGSTQGGSAPTLAAACARVMVARGRWA